MAISDGRVMSNFIVQAIKGEPLTVYGDGSQIRSFCYVDDLVDGLIKLFFTEKIFEPINIGNPEPISMLTLAKEIIELTESSSIIEMKSLPTDDPKQREPDISKAQQLLSWTPKVSRYEGLLETIKFFRSQLNCN
jgi:UDP-glucuronate decarboxylase